MMVMGTLTRGTGRGQAVVGVMVMVVRRRRMGRRMMGWVVGMGRRRSRMVGGMMVRMVMEEDGRELVMVGMRMRVVGGRGRGRGREIRVGCGGGGGLGWA